MGHHAQNPTSALKLAKGTTQTGKWKALAALLPQDATRDPNAVTAEQGEVVLRHKQLTSLDETELQFPGRGDQPPRPRRDRDRPAIPLAYRLTHS
jgi:hypothetical protein